MVSTCVALAASRRRAPKGSSLTLSVLRLVSSTDLEWKVVYVGSAESDKHDQELDTVLVGPVPVGVNKFVMQTAAPNPALIPKTDVRSERRRLQYCEGADIHATLQVLGVTVVLITCSYKGQEFIRVGYYVNNEWGEELPEGAEPPEDLEPSKVRLLSGSPDRTPPFVLTLSRASQVVRNILAEKPRVTRFPIDWE